MKYFFVGLSAIVYVAFAPGLEAKEELKLLAVEAPPFISKLPDGSLGGIFYERLKCVLEKIEQPFSIEFQPWLRAQIEVQAGRASGFLPASKDIQRDKYATLSDSLMEVNSNFYYLKDSSLKPDDPDFKERAKVSAMWGSTQYQELQAANFTLGPTAHGFDNLFLLVEHGRADAVLAPGILAETILKNRGVLNKYKKDYYISHYSGVYFTNVYLEQHPTFLSRFNKEISGCALEHSLD